MQGVFEGEAMPRHIRFHVAAVLAVLGLLAACVPPGGEDTEGAAEQEEATDAAGTAAPETGADEASGELVVARTGDIDNLDPHLATAFQTYQTLELVYDTLFEFTPDLEITAGLAESHEFNEDGTALTMTLREGVTFHDGSTFEADDVRATIERLLDEETGAVARSNLLSIESVDTEDERTVVLQLSEPDATLPAALADPNTAILSADAIEGGSVGSEPMGTGAFVFDNWAQGRSVELSAFQDYWGEGPFVESLTFRVIPDESSLLAGMRAGEFHMGVMSDPSVVTQIDESAFQVERTPALAYHALMLNNEIEPLTDPQVRQAIACAIDREEVIESATFGEGEVTGPFTIPAFESDPYAGLPCDGPDIELAQQLMSEAGYEDGFSLETIVITGEYETAINEAQSMQSQLSEIGVQLELEQLETNVYVDRWLATDFEAAVALNGGRPDPHHMYARYFTSDGNLNEVATYSDPELDELFAQGKAETDQDARAAIYEQISEHLLEASPWAWVYTGYEYRVLQPGVEGFVPMPTGSLKSLRSVRVG